MTKEDLERIYQHYVQWCQKIGVKPAPWHEYFRVAQPDGKICG